VSWTTAKQTSAIVISGTLVFISGESQKNVACLSRQFAATDDVRDAAIDREGRKDVVVVFSNGGFDYIHEKLLARLRA